MTHEPKDSFQVGAGTHEVFFFLRRSQKVSEQKQLWCVLPMAALEHKTLSDRLVPLCFREYT